MKHKVLYVISIGLFLMINTAYYWEGLLGIWNMILFLLYGVTFLILGVALIIQIVSLIRSGGKDSQKLYLIATMAIVLALCAYKPNGIVNYEYFEGKDIFVAFREGVANCTTTLKLKQNGKFSLSEICFGIDKSTGTYTISHDTILLSFNGSRKYGRQQYAVFKKDKGFPENSIGTIYLYKLKTDTVPTNIFWVFKNDLIK